VHDAIRHSQLFLKTTPLVKWLYGFGEFEEDLNS